MSAETINLFDYDGTVALPKLPIPDSLMEAKALAETRGDWYTLVTANSKGLLWAKFEKLYGTGPEVFVTDGTPMAVCMGANIIDSSGKSIVSHHLHPIEIERLVAVLPQINSTFVAYTYLDDEGFELSSIWYDRANQAVGEFLRNAYGNLGEIWEGDLEQLQADMLAKAAMMITVKPTELEHIGSFLNGVNHVTNCNGYTEITTAGVNKESAAWELAALTGRPIGVMAEDDLAGLYMFGVENESELHPEAAPIQRYFVGGSMPDENFVPAGSIAVSSPAELGNALLDELRAAL